jgi:BirA family transcriptional regulator, biotin operon repressor / biotin---[acetyl-CoA-carboxylase] ligase
MQNDTFTILDTVESTNNYAMAQVQENKAFHGCAFFAKNQWGGKGQRGKIWESEAGKNLILSLVIKPNKHFATFPFLLSAFVAKNIYDLFSDLANKNLKIKWPNDIYIGDRKAGGILIENNFKNNNWNWAIVGIGLNINQTNFGNDLNTKATSLVLESGIENDAVELAKNLQSQILSAFENATETDFKQTLAFINALLYKKNEKVKLKKGLALLETTIKHIDEFGRLHTEDGLERIFEIGEVVWQ